MAINAPPITIDRRKNPGFFPEFLLTVFPAIPHNSPIGAWSRVSDRRRHRSESSSALLPEHPGEWM